MSCRVQAARVSMKRERMKRVDVYNFATDVWREGDTLYVKDIRGIVHRRHKRYQIRLGFGIFDEAKETRQ